MTDPMDTPDDKLYEATRLRIEGNLDGETSKDCACDECKYYRETRELALTALTRYQALKAENEELKRKLGTDDTWIGAISRAQYEKIWKWICDITDILEKRKK